MSQLSAFVIDALSAGILGLQIICAVLLFLYLGSFVKNNNKSLQKLINLISENYVVLVLVITAIATAGSLTLSEVLGFAPCKLCWYQRIFMYPQVIVSFIALITNDTRIRKFILTLSVMGMLIAVYHVLLQIFPNLLQCDDETARCSAVQFARFGYITIPVMSLTGFLSIILLSLVSLRSRK